jgi:hypothetical protein
MEIRRVLYKVGVALLHVITRLHLPLKCSVSQCTHIPLSLVFIMEAEENRKKEKESKGSLWEDNAYGFPYKIRPGGQALTTRTYIHSVQSAG